MLARMRCLVMPSAMVWSLQASLLNVMKRCVLRKVLVMLMMGQWCDDYYA